MDSKVQLLAQGTYLCTSRPPSPSLYSRGQQPPKAHNNHSEGGMSRHSFLMPALPVQPCDLGDESHCYLARLLRWPETSREEHSA